MRLGQRLIIGSAGVLLAILTIGLPATTIAGAAPSGNRIHAARKGTAPATPRSQPPAKATLKPIKVAPKPTPQTELPVRVEGPVTDELADKVLWSMDHTRLWPVGKSAHITNVKVEGKRYRQVFIVIGEISADNPTTALVRSYQVTGPTADVVHDAELSPDGNFLLFKVGWPYDRHGTYQAYILDLRSHTLKAGPQENLSFPRLAWSPDSNYIAFVAGGDVTGREDDLHRLHIFNRLTGKSRFVAQNYQVSRMDWTSQGTLRFFVDGRLYEVAPAAGEPKPVALP